MLGLPPEYSDDGSSSRTSHSSRSRSSSSASSASSFNSGASSGYASDHSGGENSGGNVGRRVRVVKKSSGGASEAVGITNLEMNTTMHRARSRRRKGKSPRMQSETNAPSIPADSVNAEVPLLPYNVSVSSVTNSLHLPTSHTAALSAYRSRRCKWSYFFREDFDFCFIPSYGMF